MRVAPYAGIVRPPWTLNSYVLARSHNLDAGDGQRIVVLGRYRLLLAADADVRNGTTADGRHVALLGHAYLPLAPDPPAAAFPALLAAAADGDSLLAWLGEASGRYVVFCEDSDGSLAVYLDAAGTLPAYYAVVESGLAVSSSAEWLQLFYGPPPDQEIMEYLRSPLARVGITHLPGTRTKIAGVRQLLPNLCLEFRNRSVGTRRIFPRTQRVEADTDRVVEEASELLTRSAGALALYGRDISCALSGGLDSRISLAALRPVWPKVEFFTYRGDSNAERDYSASQELARSLGLTWKGYPSLQAANPGDPRRRFEVRSSISEVTRCFFRRKFHLARAPRLSPRAMVPLFKRPIPRSKLARFIEGCFAEWCETASFSSIAEMGYDWLDLFYWEHRAGTWQSGVLRSLETRAQPTVLFNNRRLLALLLSVPESERCGDALHIRLIRAMCPIVLDVPIVKNFGFKRHLREATEASYVRAFNILG